MRGISRGQTIHILIIPEVKDLLQRELSFKSSSNSIDSMFKTVDTWNNIVDYYENTQKGKRKKFLFHLINYLTNYI